MNELEALLWLTSIPHLGSIKIRLLIHHYGSAVDALKATSSSLAELPGFGPKIQQAWEKGRQQDLWRHHLYLAEKQGVQIISYTSPHYPKRLLEIIDFPLVLYVKGSLLKEDHRCLAIVGTRQVRFTDWRWLRKSAENSHKQVLQLLVDWQEALMQLPMKELLKEEELLEF